MKLKCHACGYDEAIRLVIMDEGKDLEDRFLECPNCGDFFGYEDEFDLRVIDNVERVYDTRYDCRGMPEEVRRPGDLPMAV